MSEHKGGKGVARKRKRERRAVREFSKYVVFSNEPQYFQMSAIQDPTDWSTPDFLIYKPPAPSVFVLNRDHWDTLQ